MQTASRQELLLSVLVNVLFLVYEASVFAASFSCSFLSSHVLYISISLFSAQPRILPRLLAAFTITIMNVEIRNYLWLPKVLPKRGGGAACGRSRMVIRGGRGCLSAPCVSSSRRYC